MSKRSYGILTTSVGLSIISLMFFYKAGLGVNFLIFSIILSLVLGIIGKIFKRSSKSLFFNCILIIVISLPFAITTAIPVLIVLYILWYYQIILTIDSFNRTTSSLGLINYITTPIVQILTALVAPFTLITKTKSADKDILNVIMRVLIGIVIAVPIFILFAYLLMSADMAFKGIVEEYIGSNLIKEFINITLWFGFVAWVVLGALYHTLYKKKHYTPKVQSEIAPSSSLFIESTTILVIVEFLFLVFNIVQITYLFGGEKMITSGDYTYSEYARKGFFELVAVSVIAMGLIGLLAKLKRTKTNIQSLIFKLVSVSGLLLILPMAISAFYKLMMYEQEYGFTRLRAYSHLFIIYLVIMMVWLGVKLLTHLKESKFLYGIYIFTLISLSVFAIINVDGTIARLNIEKYEREVKEGKNVNLDVWYLSTLSYDAVPVIMDYYDKADNGMKGEIAFYMKPAMDKLNFEEAQKDFRAFVYRRFIAKNKFDSADSSSNAKDFRLDNASSIKQFSKEHEIIANFQNYYCQDEFKNNHSYSYYTGSYWCNRGSYDFSTMTDYSKDAIRIFFMSEWDAIFSYDQIEVYSSKGKKLESKNCYNICHLELDMGGYYVVGKNWMEQEDVYKIDINTETEEIFLMKRDNQVTGKR